MGHAQPLTLCTHHFALQSQLLDGGALGTLQSPAGEGSGRVTDEHVHHFLLKTHLLAGTGTSQFQGLALQSLIPASCCKASDFLHMYLGLLPSVGFGSRKRCHGRQRDVAFPHPVVALANRDVLCGQRQRKSDFILEGASTCSRGHMQAGSSITRISDRRDWCGRARPVLQWHSCNL